MRHAHLFAALSASLVLAQTATAAEAPEATAERMLDPTRNAAAFKDPKAFAEWSAAMANPATSMALAQRGIDPNTYLRMVTGMMNPAAMQNYMQFTDPAVAMKWMQAGMNPNFYTSLMAPGLNPATYMNWMGAPISPQALNLGMQALNPAMYGNWMTAPLSPQAMGAMMAPMNPGMYTNWAGAMASPATFGPWGQMLGAPAVMPAIDPAALLKMMPVPAPAEAK